MEFKKEILIIDDDASILESIRKQLKDEGVNLNLVNDPLEGLDKINNSRFDLVICDIRMRSLNGLEVLRIIKTNHPEIPVIMLSGYVDDNMIENALNLGCEKFLIKPIRKSILIESIMFSINKT
jgi:CheY-like chemotaxis protein